MYRLKVLVGPNSGKSFNLPYGQVYVGRGDNNDIILQSHNVSKRHCVLEVHTGEVILRDQDSANGTFVNGVLAREKKLKLGDRISVGEFVLMLKPAHEKAM